MTEARDPTVNDGQENRQWDRGHIIDPETAPTMEGQSRNPVGCAISPFRFGPCRPSRPGAGCESACGWV